MLSYILLFSNMPPSWQQICSSHLQSRGKKCRRCSHVLQHSLSTQRCVVNSRQMSNFDVIFREARSHFLILRISFHFLDFFLAQYLFGNVAAAYSLQPRPSTFLQLPSNRYNCFHFCIWCAACRCYLFVTSSFVRGPLCQQPCRVFKESGTGLHTNAKANLTRAIIPRTCSPFYN